MMTVEDVLAARLAAQLAIAFHEERTEPERAEAIARFHDLIRTLDGVLVASLGQGWATCAAVNGSVVALVRPEAQ